MGFGAKFTSQVAFIIGQVSRVAVTSKTVYDSSDLWMSWVSNRFYSESPPKQHSRFVNIVKDMPDT
eukprot:5162594-Amphidinium_carterae.1